MLDDIKNFDVREAIDQTLLDKRFLIQTAGSVALSALIFYLMRKQIKAAPMWGRVTGFIVLAYSTYMISEVIRQTFEREKIKDESKAVAQMLLSVSGAGSVAGNAASAAMGRKNGVDLDAASAQSQP